jgi:hypothetical protein
VASLIEAIKKNAIEASKVLYLFCDRLAKLYLAAKAIQFADEVCEYLIGHLRIDEAIREFKFKDAFTIDTMCYDAEEMPTQPKRAQVGTEPFIIAGVGQGLERSKKLSLENGFERCTEEQS